MVAQRLHAPSACVGLDVGSHALKGVVLQKHGAALTLIRAASLPVPPGTAAAAHAPLIRQLLNILDGANHPLVAAVGGPGTIFRSVVLPKMSPKELSTALVFEAEKYIPFKLDEVFLDSAIAGDRPEGRMEVLVAAARKEVVETALGILSAAGVAPKVLDLETTALANAWELSPQGDAAGTVGVLHVGARRTIVAILTGPQLQFTRELPLGGEKFTQAVAAALSVDAAVAESLKWQPGDRAADVQAALQPSWDEWLGQCRDSFDFYENTFGRPVNRIVLSGGSAAANGLAARVREVTGLAAEVWNPLAGVSAPPPAAADPPAVTLGVAVGLARRGLAS